MAGFQSAFNAGNRRTLLLVSELIRAWHWLGLILAASGGVTVCTAGDSTCRAVVHTLVFLAAPQPRLSLDLETGIQVVLMTAAFVFLLALALRISVSGPERHTDMYDRPNKTISSIMLCHVDSTLVYMTILICGFTARAAAACFAVLMAPGVTSAFGVAAGSVLVTVLLLTFAGVAVLLKAAESFQPKANSVARNTSSRTLVFLVADVGLGLAVSGTVLGDGNLSRSAPLLIAVVALLLYCTYKSVKMPELVRPQSSMLEGGVAVGACAAGLVLAVAANYSTTDSTNNDLSSIQLLIVLVAGLFGGAFALSALHSAIRERLGLSFKDCQSPAETQRWASNMMHVKDLNFTDETSAGVRHLLNGLLADVMPSKTLSTALLEDSDDDDDDGLPIDLASWALAYGCLSWGVRRWPNNPHLRCALARLTLHLAKKRLRHRGKQKPVYWRGYRLDLALKGPCSAVLNAVSHAFEHAPLLELGAHASVVSVGLQARFYLDTSFELAAKRTHDQKRDDDDSDDNDGATSSGSTTLTDDTGAALTSRAQGSMLPPSQMHQHREALLDGAASEVGALRSAVIAWSAIDDAKLDLLHLAPRGDEYLQFMRKAHVAYATAVHAHPRSALACRAYADFLRDVAGLQDAAAHFQGRADSLATEANKVASQVPNIPSSGFRLGRVFGSAGELGDDSGDIGELLVSGLPDGDHVVMSATATAARIIGRHPADLVGSSLGSLMPPQLSRAFIGTIDAALSGLGYSRPRHVKAAAAATDDKGTQVAEVRVRLGMWQLWLIWNSSKSACVPVLLAVTETFGSTRGGSVASLCMPQMRVFIRPVEVSAALFIVSLRKKANLLTNITIGEAASGELVASDEVGTAAVFGDQGTDDTPGAARGAMAQRIKASDVFSFPSDDSTSVHSSTSSTRKRLRRKAVPIVIENYNDDDVKYEAIAYVQPCRLMSGSRAAQNLLIISAVLQEPLKHQREGSFSSFRDDEQQQQPAESMSLEKHNAEALRQTDHTRSHGDPMEKSAVDALPLLGKGMHGGQAAPAAGTYGASSARGELEPTGVLASTRKSTTTTTVAVAEDTSATDRTASARAMEAVATATPLSEVGVVGRATSDVSTVDDERSVGGGSSARLLLADGAKRSMSNGSANSRQQLMPGGRGVRYEGGLETIPSLNGPDFDIMSDQRGKRVTLADTIDEQQESKSAVGSPPGGGGDTSPVAFLPEAESKAGVVHSLLNNGRTDVPTALRSQSMDDARHGMGFVTFRPIDGGDDDAPHVTPKINRTVSSDMGREFAMHMPRRHTSDVGMASPVGDALGMTDSLVPVEHAETFEGQRGGAQRTAMVAPKEFAMEKRSVASAASSQASQAKAADTFRVAVLGVGRYSDANFAAATWGGAAPASSRKYRDPSYIPSVSVAVGMAIAALTATVLILTLRVPQLRSNLDNLSRAQLLADERSRVAHYTLGAITRAQNVSGLYFESNERIHMELSALHAELQQVRDDIQEADILTDQVQLDAAADAWPGVDPLAGYAAMNKTDQEQFDDFHTARAALRYRIDRVRWVPIVDGTQSVRILSILQTTDWLLQHLRTLKALPPSELSVSPAPSAIVALFNNLHDVVIPSFEASSVNRIEVYKFFLKQPAPTDIIFDPVLLIGIILVPWLVAAACVSGIVVRAARPLMAGVRVPRRGRKQYIKQLLQRQTSAIENISSASSSALPAGVESTLADAELEMVEQVVVVGAVDDSAANARNTQQHTKANASSAASGSAFGRITAWNTFKTVWLPCLLVSATAGVPFASTVLGGLAAYPSRSTATTPVSMSRARHATRLSDLITLFDLETNAAVASYLQHGATASVEDVRIARTLPLMILDRMTALMHGQEADEAPVNGVQDVPPLHPDDVLYTLMNGDACTASAQFAAEFSLPSESCFTAADGVIATGGIQQGILRLLATGGRALDIVTGVANTTDTAADKNALLRAHLLELQQLDKDLLRPPLSAVLSALRDDNEAALDKVRDKFLEVSAVEWALVPILLIMQLRFYSWLHDLVLASRSLLVLMPKQFFSMYVAAVVQNMIVHHTRHGVRGVHMKKLHE